MPGPETENRLQNLPAQEHNGRESQAPPPPPTPPAPRHRRWRWLILGGIAVVLLAAGLIWGVPYVRAYFTTVSTDDAYVNSHAMTVAPRIEDNVVEVLVENGNFVKAGTPLVRLDPYPYQLLVDQKQNALSIAQSQLTQTLAKVRSQESQARAAWYQLQQAQNQIHSQLASLRAQLADLNLAQANLTYARGEYNRVSRLAGTGAASAEELEQQRNAVRVSESQVTSAREALQQTRASLGLPRNEEKPLDVPSDLEETHATVQVALSNAVVSLAAIGVRLHLYQLTPKALHDQLVNMTPAHDLNRTLDQLVETAPETRVAQDQVRQAENDLEQARLNLSYTEIRAEVAGFVNQRNVNPGDHVQKGQNLMTVRSVEEVWIDANFKETQLADLVIGQPVDISVDAYPGRVFHGRVAGFTPATGSVTALLPAENATGNFVKVVQRLPVRIELTEPPPTDTPLFAGLSVVPTVRTNEPPTGPNAGQRIRNEWQPQTTTTAPITAPRNPIPRTPVGVGR